MSYTGTLSSYSPFKMATVANDFNLSFNMFKDNLLAPYWSHLLHPPTKLTTMIYN